MMLLASIVALTALMLAAAPAFANHKCNPSPNHQAGCEDQDHENNNDECDNGDDNGDDEDCDNEEINQNNDLINRLNNVGNLEVSPTFEASQETDQDCDSGDVSQPIDVSGGGDNSIMTVGVNPSANTGCSQTALGILDFDPTLAVQGGDFAFNADQFNVIQDNDCDGVDDDGDGKHDEDNNNCDDNGDDNGNDNGPGKSCERGNASFCDEDNADDGDDDGDNIVDINDRDNFRFGGDRQFVRGGGGGDEFDFDDFGSSISVGAPLTVTSDDEINQAAAASSTNVFPLVPFVVDP